MHYRYDAKHQRDNFTTAACGELHIVTRERVTNPGDSYPNWEKELTIYLRDDEQVDMVVVVLPNGTERRLAVR